MVRDKIEQDEWKHLDVNEHWHRMKKTMMETAQHMCGMLDILRVNMFTIFQENKVFCKSASK